MRGLSHPFFNGLEPFDDWGDDFGDGSEVSILAMIATGVNVDFSQPISRCSNCGDPLGKDIEMQGKMRRVPITCQCRAEAQRLAEVQMQARDLQRRLDRFKAYSLMDENFSASTFEAWVFRDDNRELYALGRQYCEKWETMLANNRGLLVHGQAGNGKTFFSFAIANELYRLGEAVMAISVSRILDIFKRSYALHGDSGEMDVLNTISEASLLILDDLGVEYKTYWSYEKLYAIIDTRYRAKKPTIITTNLLIDDAEKINELRDNLAVIDAKARHYDQSHRIYNRIVEMCALIAINGESWRIKKGKENKSALFTELGLKKGASRENT